MKQVKFNMRQEMGREDILIKVMHRVNNKMIILIQMLLLYLNNNMISQWLLMQ